MLDARRLAILSVGFVVGVALVACSAHSITAAPLDPEDAATDADAGLADSGSCYTPSASPACGFDAAPAVGDGGMGCTFGRANLICKYTGGVTSICVTGDASCDMSPIADPGDLLCCTNACAPNEYGAACVGSSPGASCHSVGIAPGGHGYYCCSCR